MTREEWLGKAVDALRSDFELVGLDVPTLRVSIGWPSQRATSKNRRIGECWHGEFVADGTPHVFISPTLSEPVDVLAVLVHEMLHAALPASAKHGAPFKRYMKPLGLEGKATATVASESLTKRLGELVKSLGGLEHVPLVPNANRPKQSTRLLKVECAQCGYTVRVTRKWLDLGAPICPLHDEYMTEAS